MTQDQAAIIVLNENRRFNVLRRQILRVFADDPSSLAFLVYARVLLRLRALLGSNALFTAMLAREISADLLGQIFDREITASEFERMIKEKPAEQAPKLDGHLAARAIGRAA